MDFGTIFTAMKANETPVRTRFAPSPTGSLHIGGIRTALVSYIIAKRFGGSFILRIEDTDQTRYVPTAVDEIIRGLDYFGITPDESPINPGKYGPYIQSQRLKQYSDTAQQMIEMGIAYKCYMSADHMKLLKECGDAGVEEVAKYYHALDEGDHSFEQIKKTVAAGIKHGRWFRQWPANSDIALTPPPNSEYVVRFAAPYQGRVGWTEPTGHKYSFANDTIHDSVLLKRDGFPTYHLAHVVDDYMMDVSHVVRGSEWMSSTPLHLSMWESLGWKTPEYIHLPVILSPTGVGKLSKRNGGREMFVMSDQIVKAGINPDAVCVWLLQNMSLLNYDEYDWRALIKSFTFSSLPNTKPGSISPAMLKKIISRMGEKDDVEQYVKRLTVGGNDGRYDAGSVALTGKFMRTRHTSPESYEKYMAFLEDCGIIDVDKKTNVTLQSEIVSKLIGMIPLSVSFNDDVDGMISDVIAVYGKKSAGVIRYAITHRDISLPAKEAALLLGKEKTLNRLNTYLHFIENTNN